MLPLLPRHPRFLARALRHNVSVVAATLRAERRPVFSTRDPATRTGATAAAPSRVTEALLTVVDVAHPTPDSVAITLATPPTALRAARPGQFVTLGVDVGGERLWRAYSCCGDPDDPTRITVIVRRVDGGRASSHLVATCAEGQRLPARGPSGRFGVELAELASTQVVLIGGGVGATPLWSLAQARRTTAAPTALLLANRTATSGVLVAEASALAASSACFGFVQAVEGGRIPRGGLRGRLEGATLERALARVDATPNAHYFVCGPAPMMDAVCAALVDRGVDPSHVHTERFDLGRADGPVVDVGPQRVTFARSGVETLSVPGETLLQTAARAGVTIGSSCRVGGCSACKTRTLAGHVAMPEPNGLTAAERDAGYVLTCVGRPTGAVTLDA
ncbi:MAG: iron-sulfur cluster-binding domain-containing protein [Myxococcales bacterium]|nr:iron-sulfur cluster-binding domain-containing protein [Myxococcales bacterium]